nr:hypothetical protein [Protofrankia symbiont of Coriaria ruscifolia]
MQGWIGNACDYGPAQFQQLRSGVFAKRLVEQVHAAGVGEFRYHQIGYTLQRGVQFQGSPDECARPAVQPQSPLHPRTFPLGTALIRHIDQYHANCRGQPLAVPERKVRKAPDTFLLREHHGPTGDLRVFNRFTSGQDPPGKLPHPRVHIRQQLRDGRARHPLARQAAYRPQSPVAPSHPQIRIDDCHRRQAEFDHLRGQWRVEPDIQ